ncbi:MAG: hypothetical protein HY835_08380, partial [Anaerolineae bacterium]|nr:hypothetical protein [Anaerolineae bacterium]
MQILLADDRPEVRAALRLLFEQGAVQVAGEAATAVQLLALCARTCPDGVILDAELSGLAHSRRSASLVELLQTLRHLCPRVRLVALSSYQITRQEAWWPHVDAAFCKSDPPDGLLGLLEGV